MSDINICNNETGDVACVIFDVDTHLTLHNLRQRIENDAGELITENLRFHNYVSCGTVTTSQEDNMLINEAIKWNSDEATISFQACTAPSHDASPKHTPLVDVTEPCAEPETITMAEADSAATSQGKDPKDTISAFSKLKSPTNCSLKGIKVYSKSEIDGSIGQEKERQVFWNQRARELSKQSIRKMDLYQQIHQEWRMYKDGAIKKVAQMSGVKKNTYDKNIMRVEHAKKRSPCSLKKFRTAISVTNKESPKRMLLLA